MSSVKTLFSSFLRASWRAPSSRAVGIGLVLSLIAGLTPSLWAIPAPSAPPEGMRRQNLPGESRISYHLRHPLHNVTGTSRDVQCEVNLGSDTARARVSVKVAASSFASGNATRDANMLELLETYRYPFIEFTGDSLRREGRPSGANWRIFGYLNFHGVKRPVEFSVTPRIVGERVYVRGAFDVRLSDYDVPRPTLLGIPVYDSLRIELSMVARR